MGRWIVISFLLFSVACQDSIFVAEAVPLFGDTTDSDNDTEENIFGCPKLVCEGNFSVVDPGDIQELAGCTEIAGDLFFENSQLTTLEGLECISKVQGHLDIVSNDFLISLRGLDGLRQVNGDVFVGGIDRGGNALLSNLSGLNALLNVNGYVSIARNGNLRDLTGLDELGNIAGSLVIASNPMLESTRGLESLVRVGRSLTIAGNRSLKNVDGFAGLLRVDDHLEIGHQRLGGNEKLVDLSGLARLEEIGQDLDVRDCASLAELSGLENLENIGGSLWIRFNKELIDLRALNGLRIIDGDLIIEVNDRLGDIRGLVGMEYFGGIFFDVRFNFSLPSCAAHALYARFVRLSPSSPSRLIQGNDPSGECPWLSE